MDELTLNLGDLAITIRRTQSYEATTSSRSSEATPALGASAGPRAPVRAASRVVHTGTTQVPRSGLGSVWTSHQFGIWSVDFAPPRALGLLWPGWDVHCAPDWALVGS